MGVDAIYDNNTNDTTKPITGTINLAGHKFQYEVFLLPIIGPNKEVVEQELIKRLGTRIQNGKHCLDITEDKVKQNMTAGEYSAMIFVKNAKHDDNASASLQYHDWCNSGKNQMWINDLCRVSSSKQTVSPVKVLFQVVEMITRKYATELNHVNLFVDNHKLESRDVLVSIYKKYGFSVVSRTKCLNFDPESKYIVMRKRMSQRASTRRIGGGRRSTRKK